MVRRGLEFLLLAVVSVASVGAEDMALGRVEESIVVTATDGEESEADVPAAATVIEREEIDRRQSRAVADLLLGVPGLSIASIGGAGAVSSVFTRGTNSTQTLFLLDGVRLNTPYFSGYDIAHRDTATIERMEIVRGPFSALWGADALGGVVQLFSRRPTTEGFAGSLLLEVGDDALRRGEVAVDGSGTGWNFAASAYGREGEGEFEGWENVAHDSYRSRGVSARVEFDLGAGMTAGVIANGLSDELEIPFENGVGSPARGQRRQENEETMLAVPIRQRVSDAWSWALTLSQVDSDQRFRDPDDSFGFTASDIASRTTQARMTHDFLLGAHELTVGGEWGRRRVDDKSSYGTSLDDQGSDVVALFVQDVWKAGDRWSAQVGFRFDDDQEFGSAASPRLALLWFTKERTTRVHLAFGTAFRAPSVGELAYPYFGNPELEPERSTSYELGARTRFGESDRLVVYANVFRNDIRDLIQYDAVTFALDNVAKARTQGLEAGAEARLGGNWSLLGSATWLDAVELVEDGPEDDLLRRPKFSASVALAGQPLAGISLDLRANYVGRREDVDALGARVENPSYTRLDLAATFTWRALAPFVRIENLFDEKYESVVGYPAPGRAWRAGVRVAF